MFISIRVRGINVSKTECHDGCVPILQGELQALGQSALSLIFQKGDDI